MADRIHLEVVTPERKVFEAEVDSVQVPGLDGEMGILPGHTELISRLKPAGLLTFHIGDERGDIAISDGYVEASPNRVVILADRAERPDEIDLAKAMEMKELAERRLNRAMGESGAEVAEAVVELERAALHVQIAERARK